MTYTKTEGGRQIFCPDYGTIRMPDRTWVSRPTPEQFALAGWVEYIPPIVPPQPQTDPDFSQVMAAVKKMFSTDTEELSDEDALDVAALFPTWASKIGSQVSVGERLWYDGKLYKVLQAHTVQQEWTPDATPALYAEVSIVEWPEWVRPISAETAYNIGDKVTFEGQHYVSLINANVYSPVEYAAGWELQP